MHKFLTARWEDLILVNYEVEPALLAARVPPLTLLDLENGRCFVSLVGFMFRNTRVLRVRVPFHVNFEEVNLRFYVKREAGDELRRGVVFIKEIVPRSAIATVARVFYGEPYTAMKMRHEISEHCVSYEWYGRSAQNRLRVQRGVNLGIPDDDSHAAFITEHYWGYTKRMPRGTDEYRVEHPKWELFDVHEPAVEVDFHKTYGEEFAFLAGQKPYSILLAKGSEISVYKGARLK
ncbi:MAG TPA: DUF2071 domain-containing protein [Pyrinomonadaceae bacterium]|nr:DUF2071 domain-containing protein [Pyrinomonadaceae bacterium]